MTRIPPVTPSTAAGKPRAPAEADPKLVSAAREFEALFVAQLLKQARQSARALSERETAPGSDVYEDWQDDAIARAVSTGRGFGLAEMLVRQLGGNPTSTAPTPPAPSHPAPTPPRPRHLAPPPPAPRA